MANTDIFAARRAQVLRKMTNDSAAVIKAAQVCLRNGDVEYPFRQNSDFYYLTGFDEPEAVLVLLADGKKGKSILFNRPRDEQWEIWNGPRLGQKGAATQLQIDEAYSIADLETILPTLLLNTKRVYCSYSDNSDLAKNVLLWAKPANSSRGHVNSITEIVDLDKIVHEQRLIKSPEEIDLLRKACEISINAHKRAMRAVQPNMMEYELEAEIIHEFIYNNCKNVAYGSIVGGGANSCILHYVANNQKLKDGDLVLVDAGAEYQNYAADITRTYPVNGKFSNEQALIYNLVLKAQLAVIKMIKPGVTWPQMQEQAVKILTKGLVELGLLNGSVVSLIKKNAYQKFYMHGIGHWLGMDVHDVGARKENGQWRGVKPGMVFTVEPGLYIAASKDVPKKWWNIGVRIEDDVVVTKSGCEVLTSSLPKTVKEIEQLMAGE